MVMQVNRMNHLDSRRPQKSVSVMQKDENNKKSVIRRARDVSFIKENRGPRRSGFKP